MEFKMKTIGLPKLIFLFGIVAMGITIFIHGLLTYPPKPRAEWGYGESRAEEDRLMRKYRRARKERPDKMKTALIWLVVGVGTGISPLIYLSIKGKKKDSPEA
ncbi:MAG: hypothetical protein GY765_34505 [bacterium]|nr:hypothetical protein [bacterium]